MSNIDKQALRQLAVDAKELAIIKRYTKGIEAQKKFIAAMTPVLVLALLDELEAGEKRIAELEAREKSLRTVGVMSQKVFQRLEGRESRFIALWPRPEIYLPRKRPDDGVIVYARVAGAGKGEAS
ncbi:TPA: ead/Ea22-like family protein [Enterobacter kobei]